MHRKQTTLTLCLLLILTLLLAGCSRSESPAAQSDSPVSAESGPESIRIGGQEFSLEATEITAVLAPGETELLDRLPRLHYADLSGSEAIDEIAAWASAHPNVSVRYTIPLPNGALLPSDTVSYDLSDATAAEALSVAPALARLPGLHSVNLGVERDAMGWEGIRQLRQILPETVFQYRFSLYGTECDLSAASINLYCVPVYDYDEGEKIDEIMNYMPQLTYVDMDSVGLPMWQLEELNLKHPNVKVVFRVWFGDKYSVRTDVEKILASSPTKGGLISPENDEGLYYCHDVKYLDLGHNTTMTDIGFVAEMPKLEVAVLAMCDWTDASPLAKCPELEYLEMFTTNCTDLTPLSGLTKLRHLNVCNIGADCYDYPPPYLTDISPLYSLTGLERLWIGGYNPVPQEQIDEMQRRAPNCEINTGAGDPTEGRWRYIGYDDVNYMFRFPKDYHPRYVKLLEQFSGKDAQSIGPGDYALFYNDPLCPGE